MSGPEVSCAFCGRWLVRLKPNGLFDITHRASFVGEFKISSNGTVVGITGVESAKCYYVRCTIRRWWKIFRHRIHA